MAKLFDIRVCPHTGGVGLYEIAQHLAMVDYLCVSKTMDNRMLEYVDHFHEHFEEPVVIDNGRYIPPKKPGISQKMKQESIHRYSFPDGEVWSV